MTLHHPDERGTPGAVMPSWLDGLNPEQREAVTYGEGPMLVLAGAGSGKTRVLTYRIAYLLAQGVQPWQILAVTFTNKAAREMRERVTDLMGPAGEGVWVGTFHATCVQILRRHADRLGYTNRFLIFDTADQQQAMARVYKDLNLDPKRHDARGARAAISAAKNELVDVDRFEAKASDFRERTIARVYRRYQEVLKENDAMDFDDLIMMTVRLFRDEPDVLEQYRNRFRHILVDEYQDTNRAQYVLIQMLAETHRNLCVVGDADQSIYAFRGADIRNILNFERDYPDAKVIKLERNYRSTQRILEAANAVIEHNRDRPDKVLWTENEAGPPVVWCRTPSERDEAEYVVEEIERLRREEGIGYGDVALLYRTHAQSRALEEAFVRRGIPYRMVAGTRFYERKEIKDIIAYLRVIANPADSFSLRRIVNVPRRGIGDVTWSRIEEGAAELGIALYDALVHPDVTDMLSAQATQRVERFHEMIEGFRREVAQGRPLTRIAELVMEETGYMEELRREKTLEAEARIENLREFLTVTSQFEREQSNDLDEFLEHVALVSDVDAWDAEADAVAMMTVHAAKGLEFPVVFMVGMEEGVFPHSRSLWESVALEEERRLCYVAMTRAEQRLYMSSALARTLMGAVAQNPPSRFLDEIPSHLLHRETWGDGIGVSFEDEDEPAPWQRGRGGGGRRRGAQERESAFLLGGSHWLSGGAASPSPRGTGGGGNGAERGKGEGAGYPPGSKVRHPVFGEGTVVAAEPSGGDWMVTVAFDGQGVKKLMAAFAKLELL